jgi:hypothetical protein
MGFQGLFILYIVILFLNGCASVRSIEQNYSNINYEDGLSENEAVIIGQRFLLNHSDGRHFVLSSGYIQRGKDFKDKKYVLVRFMSKQFMPFTKNFEAQFGLCIDKETGEVFYAGKTYVHIYSGLYDVRNYNGKDFAPEVIEEKFKVFKAQGEKELGLENSP